MSLNGTWKVVSFENLSDETVEFKNRENSWNMDITVSFDDSKNPNQITGMVTTNSVFGEFDYVGARQFKVLKLASTFVGQPEWADKFSLAISDGDVSYIINETQLRIYYDNKTKSVTLARQ
jgi:hypothetical protein